MSSPIFCPLLQAPGQGRRRTFTSEDLKVFAVVHDFHKRGYTYADAKMALANGQRGEVPEPSQTSPTIPPALLIQLRDEMTDLRLKLKAVESERDEERGQKKISREMLEEKERQVQRLYEENAVLKAQLKQQENN